MYTIWLMFLSLGALGVLVGSYCCSSYDAANPFSYLGPFSSSSIGNPVLSSMAGRECPPLYLSCTSRTSQVTAISRSSQHFWASIIVSGFCNCMWDVSLGGAVSAWSFPQTLLHTLSLYLLLWVSCSILCSSFFLGII